MLDVFFFLLAFIFTYPQCMQIKLAYCSYLEDKCVPYLTPHTDETSTIFKNLPL